MKKLTIIVLFVFFWAPFARTQNHLWLSNINTSEQALAATFYVNAYPLEKAQFFNDWTTGTIYFTSGKKATNVQLRYNGWKDELLWLRQSDYKTGTVIKGTIHSFELYFKDKTEPVQFVHYIDSSGFQVQDFLLHQLVKGKYTAYCHPKVDLIKGNNVFVPKPQYYLSINQGKLQKFKLRKSGFLALFNQKQQAEIKMLMHTHKLKLKSEQQLVQLILLLNESQIGLFNE